MSVGQVIQLDVVGESRRLLEGEAERGTDPAAADSQPPAGDQSAPAATNATESAPEGPSVKAATQNETSSETAKPKNDTNKISAGMNAGHTPAAPVQSHSAPPQKLGTPGDRFLFTESPVEYYYYH